MMKKRAKMKVTSPDLPKDIINAEILPRLPPKSLFKFKCVSKSWCCFISTKKFIKAQLDHARLTDNTTIIFTAQEPTYEHDDTDYAVRHCPVVYLFSHRETHHDVPLPPCRLFDYPIKRFMWLVGCCNGLCCINVDAEYIILWNPATGLSHKLPPAWEDEYDDEEDNDESDDEEDNDESDDQEAFGFGYDESNDDYKVLAVQYDSDISRRVYRLYSLKANSWIKVNDFMIDLMRMNSWKTVDEVHNHELHAVSLNGKLHWTREINSSSFIIVTFDLRSERAGWFEQPCSGNINWCHTSSLGVIQWCLCVVIEEPQYTGPTQVWVMKEYGVKESWYKLMTLPQLPRSSDCTFAFSILSISEGEILFERYTGIFCYNPKTERLRELNITKDCNGVRGGIALCIQTLVSPFPHEREMAGQEITTSTEKGLLQTPELYEYVMETSVYPREPEPLKELRAISSNHPRAYLGTSPDAGQLMALILKLINARNTIEVGVFTGYSLLLTALAIPDDGKITAIDMDRSSYEIGLPIIEKSGVKHKINFIESEALPALEQLSEDPKKEESFDFAFVDADKINYANYHEKMMKLVKRGGTIMYDNTLWGGTVAMPEETVPEFRLNLRQAAIEFNKYLANDTRVQISLLPVGDGITICRRL